MSPGGAADHVPPPPPDPLVTDEVPTRQEVRREPGRVGRWHLQDGQEQRELQGSRYHN